MIFHQCSCTSFKVIMPILIIIMITAHNKFYISLHKVYAVNTNIYYLNVSKSMKYAVMDVNFVNILGKPSKI